MENKVSLVKCDSYDQNKTLLAVENAINLLGGLNQFIKKGQRVALKVNLLMKATPEKAMTTHPAVVYAVAKLVKDFGAEPFIVDSAGGPFTAGYINGIYSASGLKKVAEDLGVELNQNFEYLEVDNPSAKVGFKFPIVKTINDADAIINLSKLKTHSFTGYTNAVKNMFGIIPGLTKVEMHGKYRDLDTFMDFLFDIHSYLGDKLVLNITDAVIGMEGYGPSNGTPKHIGAILAGKSAVNVDYIATQIIGLTPERTPTLKTAISRNVLQANPNIEVVGEKISDMVVKDFKTIEPNNFKPYANYVPSFLQNTVHRLMTKRPVISKLKCKGCRKCHDHCPVKAISMQQKKDGKLFAKIDYNKCIRCYCCQELCPFGVVKVKSGLVYKLVHLKDKK